MQQNSYKLIQACDWLIAILSSVVQTLRVNWQSHIFAHRQVSLWLLLHNFALMQLENLQHFSNLRSNFWFDEISHRWFMCTLIFCRGLAESDITVTPSVKCMDSLHQWYNHAAHLVSPSTAPAFLNNMREKRKSTWPSAMQVKNCFNTVGTEEKLDAISWLKKGRLKCYTYCNVRPAHSSIQGLDTK